MAISHKRSFQKGVVSSELAIALPILVLVLGGTMTLVRLANAKIDLDRRAAWAVRQCAMTTAAGGNMAQCITLTLTNSGFDRCTDLNAVADPVDLVFDDEETQQLMAMTTWATTVTCKFRLFAIGAEGTKVELSTAHTVASN
ncbi:MAG: TadE/TadG family type IV pilus assembly protein [Myxococcota bacterium]|nr:TadE/TadG family type IV pilus assembly protein [Myxococcota bacterium]